MEYTKMERMGNREVKSTLFAKLFEDNESKIELFNALTGEDIGPNTEILEVTLDDALYHGKKNDMGFIVDGRFLILNEHQSTINENMPMRELQYVARTFETITASKELYKAKLIKVPMPEFFVIYTGDKPWGKDFLRLSDCFMTSPVHNSMELVVKIIDIRYNKDDINPILERCSNLKGYSILLSYLSEAKEQGCSLTRAIDIAVNKCMSEGILEEFLRRNSSEMGSFLFDDITTEEFIELRAEERAEDLVEEKLAKRMAKLEEYTEEIIMKRAEELAAKRAEELAAKRAEELAAKRAEEIAITMKQKGFSVEEIAELTSLEKEKIEKL